MSENRTIMPWKNAILETKNMLVSNLKLEENQKVLVLCCGIGTEAFMIKEIVGPKGYVLGIDINKDAIDIAIKRKKKYIKNGIDFLVKDAENIDEYFNMFDRVCCIFGMHYFENKINTINYWSKCLKPGGILSLAEWVKSNPNPVIDKINKVVREYVYEERPLLQSSHNYEEYKRNFIEDIKIINMSFEFPFESPSDYWDTFRNNDLFYRVKNEIGESKFENMENDIQDMLKDFKQDEITEIKNVRISMIQI